MEKEFDIFNKADMERMMDKAFEESLADKEETHNVRVFSWSNLTKNTLAEVTKLPKCNYCDSDAEYDARTIENYAIWANFCGTHFETHSTGELGSGLGQKLILVNEVEA